MSDEALQIPRGFAFRLPLFAEITSAELAVLAAPIMMIVWIHRRGESLLLRTLPTQEVSAEQALTQGISPSSLVAEFALSAEQTAELPAGELVLVTGIASGTQAPVYLGERPIAASWQSLPPIP